MKNIRLPLLIWICTLLVMSALSGCVSYSKISYFKDIDNLNEPSYNPPQSEQIKPFDKLSITVISTDGQTSALLNSYGQNNQANPEGYIIDKEGYIDYPFVGKVKLSGLSIAEARDTLRNAMSNIIREPVVIIDLIEKWLTIMGEVNNPGRYLITGENINIYEAISLGNGLAQYADRTKVILLRSEGEKQTYYRLNLSNSEIASSPLFHIQSDDIVIVEPLKKKKILYQNTGITTILTSITAIFSLIMATTRF